MSLKKTALQVVNLERRPDRMEGRDCFNKMKQ